MDEKIVKDSQCLVNDLANDCIGRKAAIDAVLDRMNVEKYGRNAKPEEIQWALEKLPSAQPEPKRGQWEMLQMPISPPVYKCSVCGSHALQSMTGCLMNRHYEANLTNYCPNCGARMEEPDD